MITRSQAIKNFLTKRTHHDLSELYSLDMECQVLVAQDHGTLVRKEFRGRQYHTWECDGDRWNSFRIPRAANTDDPYYQDIKMSYDLEEHAEAIGMTGWDWKNQQSIWVAYDFDSIVNHSKGISPERLEKVQELACQLDYVTVRQSTSGTGLHLYVFLDPVRTLSHKEHSAVARAVLGKMCADTGHDFSEDIDCLGGNMWVWGRKAEDDDGNLIGLELIKQGGILDQIPINWKDHVDVVRRRTSKVRPAFIADKEEDEQDDFEKMMNQRLNTPLDDRHKALMDFLVENNYFMQWFQDHHMLVTHTYALLQAHKSLGLKGIYRTVSQGTEGGDHNCYCFPLPKGAWSIRRFTKGAVEAETWSQDSSGWTRCYFNREPDIKTAANAHEGIEDTDGGFQFHTAESAVDAAQEIGISIDIPYSLSQRACKLKLHPKTGRLVVEITHEQSDMPIKGWLIKAKKWQRIFGKPVTPPEEPEVNHIEDDIRHCVDEDGTDAGWYVYSNDSWHQEPLLHVKHVLASMGYAQKEANMILGMHVTNCWKLVNRPFKPEYLGERDWNYRAAQFAVIPKDSSEELSYPTWMKILEHCGQGLDECIVDNEWCVQNGIMTGSDYLKCWIASLFQQPLEPLPYLFLFGPQNCGKSILHEALTLLIKNGVHRADTALTSTGNFNGELKNIVLAIVEETNLGVRKNSQALNKMKDWVTSPMLQIHQKQKTPAMLPNSLHFIQTANDLAFCPIFPGDTRVTVIRVPPLEVVIPKRQMFEQLKEEAVDFLTEVLNLEVPWSPDRLNIPVIKTREKTAIEDANEEDLNLFIKECCFEVPGSIITISDFWTGFKEYLDPEQQAYWTKRRLTKEMAKWVHRFPKGRRHYDGAHCFGNISFDENKKPSEKIVLKDNYLE